MYVKLDDLGFDPDERQLRSLVRLLEKDLKNLSYTFHGTMYDGGQTYYDDAIDIAAKYSDPEDWG